MTVGTAEGIIERMHTGVKIAVCHRFAGDKGTILRLDNYAMINIFDDGRYYIQGDNTEELVIAFGIVEEAWDPDTWTSKIAHPEMFSVKKPSREIRPGDLGKRFEF